MGIPMELMVKDDCADVSAITGNAEDTNALIKQYQMGINVAVVTPFVSGALATTPVGIKKFDFLP
jgi:hypothetical protein